MSPNIVQIRRLTRVFPAVSGTVEVLRGVDLDIRFGELLLLVGPSGCGKTTLVSILAGMLQITSGEINFLDTDMSALSGRELAEFRGRSIGMVFQELHLFPFLSAAQNAALPLIAAGIDRRVACKKACELLQFLGLADKTATIAKCLSGGERQRVALARALIHEPPLVICDEPTSALDRDTGLGLMSLLRRATVEKGRTAIVVTHDPRLFEFADRVAVIEDGRIDRVEISGQGVWRNDPTTDVCRRNPDRNIHRPRDWTAEAAFGDS